MKNYLITIKKNPKGSPVIWHSVFLADEDVKKVEQNYIVRPYGSVKDSDKKVK